MKKKKFESWKDSLVFADNALSKVNKKVLKNTKDALEWARKMKLGAEETKKLLSFVQSQGGAEKKRYNYKKHSRFS